MTEDPETKAAFLLRRAEEESILAIRADQSPAGDAHLNMALLYSARAREALDEGADDAPAFGPPLPAA